ncbi:hypothetical protein U9M48_025805 [Paspalum notatum var. saurae]|uniref:NB-ARC domain-containing protein n=1 Tax=Paspalum notatum var. saurae TaxID=547442 RepID=A0AAQ3WY35_PASNO
MAMEALEWLCSAATSIYGESQLNTELDRLRATLPKARMLICRGEWGMFKNKELANLLFRLKDTTYNAEDLLRELDDEALRLRVEDAERSRAGQLLSSSLNNIARVFVRRSKTRIHEAQAKLDTDVSQIEGVLNLMGLMSVEPSQIMPETSSVISAQDIVGRDDERDALIEMLGVTLGREAQRDQVIQLLGVPISSARRHAVSIGKRAAASCSGATSRAKQPKGSSGRPGPAAIANNITENVSVISIVGIGGVGKTTLAQFIYNDPRVKHHFGVMIWVCVSDYFDKRRITKEIIESIPAGEEFNSSSCSLNALQVELMERLKKCQKFLLVLYDIWPNANADWEAFYAALRHGPEGSMILVTTRSPVVATRVTTSNCEPVQLKGLPTDIFWGFFRKCAFGRNDPESYPHLQDIGQIISTRLCGSPLAAKTLGRLLNMSPTEQHWRTIQKSELWELQHEENEILPALQLSYLYLPEKVKRCFVFCSMFPKDYSFERDEIVDIWVAEGFVAPRGSMCPEDVGIEYLDELRNRFLFQTDPKYLNGTRYVMHDLIHDMAMSFSMDECLVMQDSRNQHMRVCKIQFVTCQSKFGTRLGAKITWFNQLSNILFLSLKGCKLVKLPESICELNSLRYLDISNSSIKELPKKLWCLYSLQVFDASRSSIKRIHQDVTRLTNLRQLAVPAEASQALSRVRGIGNLSYLRNLSEFRVAKESGRRIGELKFMNQLSGRLSIKSLCNVGSEEEAAEARLVEKQNVKELVLYWRNCGSGTRFVHGENGVLEGLRPHSRIECLKPDELPSLRSLELLQCNSLKSLLIPCLVGGTQTAFAEDDGTHHASYNISHGNGIASFAFARLTSLRVHKCWKLTNLEQFLTPDKLPCIQSITLEDCRDLAPIPVHSFVGCFCLRDLKICNCPKLGHQRQMGMSFLACLENLTSLTLLQLVGCHHVKCIPLSSIGSNMLKCLVISFCWKLSSIGGLQGLASIQHVELPNCHKLTEVQLPFKKKELQTKEEKELLTFLYNH